MGVRGRARGRAGLAGGQVPEGARHRRRRGLADAAVWYWQLGMVCLAVAVVLWTAGRVWAPLATDPRYPVLLGALMIPGFALAVINGMLYKIVPFLVWLHLALAPAAPGRPVRPPRVVEPMRTRWWPRPPAVLSRSRRGRTVS